MAYFDSIKIGGTIKQVQVVQELKALPSPVLETSPQLVKIGNDLYMRESKMGGLYGTYRFMLVPTNQQVYNVVFVSNGQTFGEIIINTSGEMTYNNTLVYSNGNWVNEKYKTIAIFDGNFTNALDTFLRNNTEKIIDGYFKYIKVSSDGGAGTTIIDITDLDEIPTQYQDAELLKTAILFDVDHLLRLTWIDDMYYYGNTDDFQYRYLSVDTNDFVIMRYDLQDIAKAPKIVDLNNFVPKTATQGTLERGALNVLQASNENYIVFNDEIFRLADKQHNAGYLVYSHNGHDTTGCFFQKCITITLSSRAWVLETQENQTKLTAGDNITIENNVISATGGGGTSDTAYVSDSTLYIEEGTTAGGGAQKITLTATPYTGDDFTLFDDTGPFFFLKDMFFELPSKIVDFNNTDISIDDGSGETFLLQYDASINKYIIYMDAGGLDNKIAFYYVETTNKYLLIGTEGLSLMGAVLTVDKNNTNAKDLNTYDYELLMYLIDKKILTIKIPADLDENAFAFAPSSVCLIGVFLNVFYIVGTTVYKFVVNVVLKNAQFDTLL